MLPYTSTPIQEIFHRVLDQAGVRLLVKREDLNHPKVSGNKWWKLKYNLLEARKQNKNTLLTFGGAYSNHIYATAGAAAECGLNSVGIIRGEETLPLNTTLRFALNQGMQIHYVSREQYRNKNDEKFIESLRQMFGDFFLMPEGGTNMLAVHGCKEFSEHDLKSIPCDYLCVAVGTGGTMAGMIAGLKGEKEIIGFPVLKGGDFLEGDITNLVQHYTGETYGNWRLDTSYHHGGYAKMTPSLIAFIQEMSMHHGLPLDHVYTGKLLWGIMDHVMKNKFPRGATILALHSGGLQGALGNIAYSPDRVR